MIAIRGMNLLSSLIFFVICSAATAAESWETYQGDVGHTGYVPVAVNPTSLSLKWQKVVGDGTKALNPIAAADGKVFITELGYFNNAGLYTLEAQTGSLLWQLNYGSISSVNPPAYSSGRVYIQTGNHSTDTYLRAYDANTGALTFQAAHAAQWERYYAPTIRDNVAYVNGGYYGGMYAFDSNTGSQLWFTPLSQYDQWTPAIDADNAYTYLGGVGLQALNRSTGAIVFSIPDPGFIWNGWSMNQAPVLGSQGNVFAFNGGRLINFDLNTRTIKWQILGNFTSQPTVAKGLVYAISSGALTVRDETTGGQIWAWGVPTAPLIGTIVVTENLVFVRTATTVYAVDQTLQTSIWSYPASGHLAWSGDTLYVAGASGSLTAINAKKFAADISVTVTDSPAPVALGNALTYSIVIQNQGPDAAHNVSVRAAIPSNVSIVSTSAGCAVVSNELTCATASLAPGGTLLHVLTVLPQAIGTVSLATAVNGDEFDPNVANNSSVVNTSVVPGNVAPTANAGPDVTVRKSVRKVTLNGSLSYDPDGSIVSYAWKQVSGYRVKLYNGNSSKPYFNMPNEIKPLPNALVFELRVTDNKGATSTDQVVVNVIR